MKSLLILLIVSTSYAYPVARTWTLDELSRAISWKTLEAYTKDPDQKALVDAYNEMMAALNSGKESYVQAIRLSPSGSKIWTTEQLTEARTNNDTDATLRPYLDYAYFHLMQTNRKRGNGTKEETVQVWVPMLDISTWTDNEVSTTLKDPEVKPELLPFLEEAQKQFDEAKAKGEKLKSVKVITTVGVIPKPEGEPILFVARPVHDNMLANKAQVIAHYNSQRKTI